ncbi:MAG: hypothetical protein DRG33_04475 [Deltaproteobacteria bacterium]|nr:MAG: hypothetical protein DRG33_04475 [Deltaproteobacteria bacterium]
MILQREHARLLMRMLEDREKGQVRTAFEETEEGLLLELEMADLVRPIAPLQVELTYTGMEVTLLLRRLIREGKLRPLEEWPEGWRWVGSEVIAMLDAASRAGRVGPWTEEALLERGLAAKEGGRVVVNEAGRRLLELYHGAEPKLEISASLASSLRKTPIGPAPQGLLPLEGHEKRLLEAMRLIAFSIPLADIYALTALGQAVKETLTLGGFAAEGGVLTEDILWAISRVADGEEMERGTTEVLQGLGYVNEEGELTPAGEWALEVFRLWREGARRGVWSFALEAEEGAVLRALGELAREGEATFKDLQKALAEQKAYFVGEPVKLRQALYVLEAMDLVETAKGERGEVFLLTEAGQEALKDQLNNPRRISSTSVKAITMTRKTFSAPNPQWFEKAREEGLVGTAEPTKAGFLYARLAERVRRKPYMSRPEMELFSRVVPEGVSVDELVEGEEERKKALERLEALHLVDILPDGNVVMTEAGRLMEKALSSVPLGLEMPVTPLIYRAVKAMADTGVLYSKERRVRVLPSRMKEAERRSGLPPEAMGEAMKAARMAGFLGKNSVTETGLALLEAAEKMNPLEVLEGYKAKEIE